MAGLAGDSRLHADLCRKVMRSTGKLVCRGRGGKMNFSGTPRCMTRILSMCGALRVSAEADSCLCERYRASFSDGGPRCSSGDFGAVSEAEEEEGEDRW